MARGCAWRGRERIGRGLGGGLFGGFYEEVLRDADGGTQVGYKESK
jgi:hypothetical protein